MGVEVQVTGLTKSFGRQLIWGDVSLTLPPGEVSVLLGPSGTGKSVFLKSLVGLLKPERGSIVIHETDLVRCSERRLYDVRKLFGVLFQDGALFGSMNLYDNIAFPLREHTRKGEREIREIVLEKMEMVGLLGAERKLPGEISGGMRKRAGLARALVLDPEIILFDEPDSGLDPVRVAYLNQLIVDLNAQTDATFLIVTHDIGTARTVPDNLGLLFLRRLVMFGPREQLLTSREPVVEQFLNGRREGPIGMSEEKDADQVAAELASLQGRGAPAPGTGPKGASGNGVPRQLEPSPGLPVRAAVRRRQMRVVEMMHTMSADAQAAIRAQLPPEMLRLLAERDRIAVSAAAGRAAPGNAGPPPTPPPAPPTPPSTPPPAYPPAPPMPPSGPPARRPGPQVGRPPVGPPAHPTPEPQRQFRPAPPFVPPAAPAPLGMPAELDGLRPPPAPRPETTPDAPAPAQPGPRPQPRRSQPSPRPAEPER